MLLAFFLGFSSAFLAQVAADRVQPNKPGTVVMCWQTNDDGEMQCKVVDRADDQP